MMPRNEPPFKKQKIQKRNKEKHPKVIPDAAEDQCHFWVQRKHRYCKLNMKKGQQYCGEHLKYMKEGVEMRIPCPFDGKQLSDSLFDLI